MLQIRHRSRRFHDFVTKCWEPCQRMHMLDHSVLAIYCLSSCFVAAQCLRRCADARMLALRPCGGRSIGLFPMSGVQCMVTPQDMCSVRVFTRGRSGGGNEVGCSSVLEEQGGTSRLLALGSCPQRTEISCLQDRQGDEGGPRHLPQLWACCVTVTFVTMT